MIETLFETYSLSLGDMATRLILATFLGLLLGLDRDYKNKPIDFRAYMFICLGASGLGILTLEIGYMMQFYSDTLKFDVAKVVAGVLTGIGFVAAGAIIKQGSADVTGTATGTSIWVSGCIGLFCGFGLFLPAIMMTIIVLFTLIGFGVVRKKITGESDKETSS